MGDPGWTHAERIANIRRGLQAIYDGGSVSVERAQEMLEHLEAIERERQAVRIQPADR